MRAQFQAAVSALFVAFLTILIAIIGLQFVALGANAGGVVFHNPLAAPVWLLQTVVMLLLPGYLAGIIGWLFAFALRRSGMHRMAAAQTWIARR